MRRIPTAGLLAILLAGCGAHSKTSQLPVPITLAGAPGIQPASTKQASLGPAATLRTQAAGPATAPLPAPKVLCDAPALAYLVGRPRTVIPVPADLSHRRVTCATCPGPEDYRPDRTDILFNAKTGIITAVTCG